MNFINPFYLFGLLAATVPIIIHLLNLRKQKKVEFSTLIFLKEMQKTKIRNVKIKKWLLLIIRTLIIICLVLAFSRPTIKSVIPGFGLEAQKSQILLIDNSYSMDYKDEKGIRLEQAKKIALEIVKKNPKDEFMISTLTTNNENLYFTKDIDNIEEQLKKIKVENYNENFSNSFNNLIRLVELANNNFKVINVISDLPKSYFIYNDENKEEVSKIKIENNENLGVIFFSLKSKNNEVKNISIDDFSLENNIIQKDYPFEVKTSIKNHFGHDAKNVVLNLYLNNERVAQRIFDLKPYEFKEIFINHIFKTSGVQNLYLEIENDALDFDNYKYFNVKINDKPKILLVGNDKSNGFLELILSSKSNNNLNSKSNLQVKNLDLNTNVSSSDIVYLTKTTTNKINEFELKDFNVVILTDYNLSDNDQNNLLNSIQEGTKVICFSENITNEINQNNQVKTTNLNNYESLILRLNQLQQKNRNSKLLKIQTNEGDFKISNYDETHPIFKGLFKKDFNQNNQIESPKINSYTSISNLNNIIYVNKDGILQELNLDKGKILFFGINNNLNQSNFPLVSLYPALIYKSILYISSEDYSKKSFEVNSKTLLLDNSGIISNNLKIIGPDKYENFPTLINNNGQNYINIGNYKRIGNYNLFNENNLYQAFQINLPPNESYFYDQITNDIIKVFFDNLFDKKLKFEIISDLEDITKQLKNIELGSEIWKIFVLLALFLSVAEMLIQKYYFKID